MGTDLDRRIGQQAAAARQEAGMTQQAVADAMRERNPEHRWSQSTVWSVEKGDRPLRAAEVYDLAVVLNIGGMVLTNPTPAREAIVRLSRIRNSLDRSGYDVWDSLNKLATDAKRLHDTTKYASRVGVNDEDRGLLIRHVAAAEAEYTRISAFLESLNLDGVPSHGHADPLETLHRRLVPPGREVARDAPETLPTTSKGDAC